VDGGGVERKIPIENGVGEGGMGVLVNSRSVRGGEEGKLIGPARK